MFEFTTRVLFSGKEMKKKWKNIKDNFFKYMNEGKSGASAPKKKKYVYAEALNFLLASIDKRETSGNIEEIKDIPFDDNETVLDSPQPQPQASPQAPPQPGVPKPCHTKKNQKFTPFQSQLLQKLDNEKSKQDDNDPDRLFLLSLLADYKTMSDDDKFEFKINSLRFIREANNRRQMGNTTPSSFPFRSQFSQPENSSQCLQPLLNRSDALQFSVVSPQGTSSSSVYSEYQTEYQYM